MRRAIYNNSFGNERRLSRIILFLTDMYMRIQKDKYDGSVETLKKLISEGVNFFY